MGQRLIVIAAIALALALRLYVALALPPQADGDATVYAQFATNLLQRQVYSSRSAPPFEPTYERVPGYPLFLAALRVNARAVRVVQAIVDAATCALAGAIAFVWAAPDRKRRACIIGTLLLAVCPFTAIYVGHLLTEVWALFFITAMVLAVSTRRFELAGLCGGIGAMFRIEVAAFFAAAAIFAVITERRHPAGASWKLAHLPAWMPAFLTFLVVLLPWTIRNARVFGIFEPLAPVHATMPQDHFPTGYMHWLATWVDDFRYVPQFEWIIERGDIDIDDMPPGAFDSTAERQRVSRLIDAYEDEGEITPAIDAQFEAIARERVARHPMRFFILLPLRRAISMWRDFRWLYLLLGLAGAIALRKTKWLLLLALLIVPRLIGAAMLPNPEPRYTVELLPLLIAAAAVALSGMRADRLSGALRRSGLSRR